VIVRRHPTSKTFNQLRRAGPALPLAFAVALALVACTFDPLDGWAPPRSGTFQVGDPVGGGSDAFAGDALPEQPRPFRVRTIEPEFGDPQGDELVLIRGSGFVSNTAVYFGDLPGNFTQTHSDEMIFTRTPRHPAGVVDVVLVHPDGREAVLRGGFLFGTPTEIHSVTPARGPTVGGTPVTVRGEGFHDDTHIVLGGRLLIAARRIDAQTIVGITAGLDRGFAAGPVDVIASSPFGAATLFDGFAYEEDLSLDGVTPAAGPAAGGNLVLVEGAGFGPDARVFMAPHGSGSGVGGAYVVPGAGLPEGDFVEARVVERAADGRALRVRVPEGAPGRVDVLVSVPGSGSALQTAAYTRLTTQPSQGDLRLRSVHPPTGHPRGGNEVVLAVSGLAGPVIPAVSFGAQPALVVDVDRALGAIVAVAPAGAPGPVTVRVAVGGDETFVPAGYRYLDVPVIHAVEPAEGPFEGGTPVTIRGSGFMQPATVRVGGLLAAEVQVVDDATITAVTPPGAPGLSDVRLAFGDRAAAARVAVLPEAFHYTYPELALFAVSTSQGAVAGGTYVELYGAGLPVRPGVRFGERLAVDATRLSPSRIVAYTPAGRAVGAVDVAVFGPGTTSILSRAFRYFDPYGDGPGTWGGPIRGAVNVTVVAQRTMERIPNGVVILDHDPDGPYRGFTNAQGQVTLSGPGLRGRRTVTATALNFDAQTFVSVDAANVILVLTPDVPPDQGTTPGQTLPSGALGGRVAGVVKYVPVPLASCDDALESAFPLCLPCEVDEDCRQAYELGGEIDLLDLRCSDLGEQGLRCTSACGEGCPDGFACSRLASVARCLPSVGRRRSRCEVTRRSPFWLRETPEVEVDPETGVFALDTRLGEVAIVCLGGYEDWETGEFVPTRMGVRRNVVPKSGDVVTAQDVQLNIPLTRTLHFRFDPPLPADLEPDFARLGVHMDLGADGVYTLGADLAVADDGTFTLNGVPERFTDELADATLSLFGGRYTRGDVSTTPYTEVIVERIADVDLARRAILVLAPEEPGRFVEDAPTPTRAPRAVYTLPDGARLVAGDGGLLLWGGLNGSWAPQPPLGTTAINAIHGSAGDAVAAVGDGGAFYHHDGFGFRKLSAPTTRDLRGVYVAGPERMIAVGEHRIVEYDHGEWTVLRLFAPLHAVAGRHWEDVLAVGEDGVMLHRGADGWRYLTPVTTAHLYGVWLGQESAAGFVVGAGGTLLAAAAGAFERVAWESDLGFAPTGDLLAVFGVEQGPGALDVMVVGDSGVAVQFDGRRWRAVAGAPPEQRLTAVHRSRAEARWTAVGPRVFPVGPLLPVPRFSVPETYDPTDPAFAGDLDSAPRLWDGRVVRFEVAPGAPARATLVNIASATGANRWRVLVPGHLREFQLPDLVRAFGFSPVPAVGRLRLRAQRALWPHFDIDSFRNTGSSYADWKSWTYDYRFAK
jgi:hypothetical protein